MQCGRTRELLSEYLDNELAARTRKAVSEHLHTCGPCQSELEILRAITRESSSLAVLEPPADLRNRILSAVSEPEVREGAWTRLKNLLCAQKLVWAAGFGAGAAAVVLLMTTAPQRVNVTPGIRRVAPPSVTLPTATVNANRESGARQPTEDNAAVQQAAGTPVYEYAAPKQDSENIGEAAAHELPEAPAIAQPDTTTVEERPQEIADHTSEEAGAAAQNQPPQEIQPERPKPVLVKSEPFEHVALSAPAVSKDNAEWIRTVRLQARPSRQEYP